MAVHFVGFRGDEYLRAQRVWGPPDFVHHANDHRTGEVGDGDILVYANKAREDVKIEWTRDDSAYF